MSPTSPANSNRQTEGNHAGARFDRACQFGRDGYLGSVILSTNTPWTAILLLATILSFHKTAGCAENSDPIEGKHFTFYCPNEYLANFSDSVLTKARQRFISLLGDSLRYRPAVHIVENQKEFDKLVRGMLPDWGAAAAFPQRKLMAIKSPERFKLGRNLSELLVHEYSHLIVAQRTGFHSAPRWFNEGMSMYMSMEWSWTDNLSMSRAAVFGQLIPLREIGLVNRFAESKAQVAYAESYLVVKFLFDEYGVSSINKFLDAIGRGESVNRALLKATGSNYSEFDSEFRKFITKRYNIVSLFMDTLLLWLGLAVVVVVGALMRFRSRRQVYKRWEEEEKLQSTDFDYGDPDHPEKVDDDEPWRH